MLNLTEMQPLYQMQWTISVILIEFLKSSLSSTAYERAHKENRVKCNSVAHFYTVSYSTFDINMKAEELRT